MKIHLWGTDFRRASPELRARLFCPPERREAFTRELLAAGFSDLVCLYTCNRIEFYTTAKDHFSDTRHLWFEALKRLGLGEEIYFQGYHFEGKAAVRHLMRVASSLESLVIGEPQILGQLKEAVRWTKDVGLPLSGSLERIFQLAFETAKRIRTQTALGEGTLSVASLGLQHLQMMESAHPLGKVVIVGRGPISLLVVQWLQKNRPGTPLLWANRDIEKLKPLLGERRIELSSLTDFLNSPPDFTHLFTATASLEPIFTDSFFARLSGRPVVFDFAQPPDVERTDRAVVVHLEDLSEEAKKNAAARSVSVREAEMLIDQSLRDHILAAKEAPILKEFSDIEPRFAGELEQMICSVNAEIPLDIQPTVRRWAEKLVKRHLHKSREHLRRLLRQAADGDGTVEVSHGFREI